MKFAKTLTDCSLALFYPPSQKTTGLPVDECVNACYAPARCRPAAEADNRVEAGPSKDWLAPVLRSSPDTEDGKTGNLMGPRVYPWGSISSALMNI